MTTTSTPQRPVQAAGPATGQLLRVAVIGNPNTGKSTLFNALTGLRQRVGNYAGVTVERAEGDFQRSSGGRGLLVDLPGTYSLSASSPDEEIALGVLLGRMAGEQQPHVVVVVVDARNVERNLFLASQVLELGLPTIIALNQMDAAHADGIGIDIPVLIQDLGATVVPTVATRGEGLEHLKRAIELAPTLPPAARGFELPNDAAEALAPVEQLLLAGGLTPAAASMEALRLLGVAGIEGHLKDISGLPAAVREARGKVEAAGLDPRSLEAELRYAWIGEVVSKAVSYRSTSGSQGFSDKLDKVLLHRAWGPVIFIGLMALVFQAIFTWAAPMMDGVEQLVAAFGSLVGALLPEGDFRGLVVDGVIAGVGSVVVFLPQIAILFLFIGLLEDTGYMSRAAFIMDRVMRTVGLHGRSFIPMLSGYACAVPAIMSARVIEEPKDRLATIMVLPLMSCSARLPVYTLLIGAFVPAVAVAGVFDLRGLTMLGMYLLGTVAALAMAAVFKKTLLKGPVRPLIMELPPYRLPDPRSLLLVVTQRCMMFLRRAGTVILALSIVLWALASYPKSEPGADAADERAQEVQLANSYLGKIGHAVEPAVRPLGFDWKIGVSIVSSFAAREVFVASMGTIYGVGADDEDTSALTARLRNERRADGTAAYTTLTAISLMVFYVFALMCMSTTAITVREAGGGWTGVKWASLQFGYMLVLAWVSAWLVYQIGGGA